MSDEPYREAVLNFGRAIKVGMAKAGALDRTHVYSFPFLLLYAAGLGLP